MVEQGKAIEEERTSSILIRELALTMMDTNYELATRLLAEEQGELTNEERSRFFVKLMDERELDTNPPAKSKKSYDEIQKLFDKEMKRVNTFVAMDSEVVEGCGRIIKQ
ncbi:hypothetical protein Tco_1005456 [Tanacetum coccineum]|uniref:Uncharacterized protein n=1 Tax=Tanacetum coccineum TaxID=301880 RepID=A0ABQ5FG68_9ASTR